MRFFVALLLGLMATDAHAKNDQKAKPALKAKKAASAAKPTAPIGKKRAPVATIVDDGERDADTTSPALSDAGAAALHEQLLAVLHDRPLSHARVGVIVMRASDGTVLFSHNAERAFNPASNTKMLTTASAIGLLGGNFRYRTSLWGPTADDDGMIHGDVTLRGSGDPSLTRNDLGELVKQLREAGVQHIAGDLVVDTSFHSDGKIVPGEPPLTALIYNRNIFTVHVEPGSIGHAPHVWVEPDGEHFVIDNKATTVKGKKSRLKIGASRDGDRMVVSIRGRIAESRGEYVDKHRVGDGALMAGWAVRSALAGFAIELDGKVRVAGRESDEDDKTALLAVHESAPLSDICKLANKPSNNFISEVIFKTTGGELFGGPGTFQKGIKAIGEYLGRMGLPSSSYHIVNGSGLTHENRITPGALAKLLRGIYFDLAVAPDFLNSLAIGGVDGTIKARFRGTEAAGLVRAKTGTLTGVSALSGYVGDKDDVIVFSILVEGFRGRAKNEVRRSQVRMVTSMLRFLRKGQSLNEPPTEPGTETEPGDDSEADGDPEGTPGQ